MKTDLSRYKFENLAYPTPGTKQDELRQGSEETRKQNLIKYICVRHMYVFGILKQRNQEIFLKAQDSQGDTGICIKSNNFQLAEGHPMLGILLVSPFLR